MAASVADTLREKIRSRRARTGVVGLGYVGLPLAVELAKAGFHATGIDLDPRKVQSIADGVEGAGKPLAKDGAFFKDVDKWPGGVVE